MSKKKPARSEVKLEPGYDHQKSDLVDVYANDCGEFVQVWSPGRELVILSYQRTPDGPKDISRREIKTSGVWRHVEYWRNKRTYVYRDCECEIDPVLCTVIPQETIGYLGGKRIETDLPNGQMLVVDVRNGFLLDTVWTADFDWIRMKPRGRRLGDRAIEKLKLAKIPVYVTSYQCRVVDSRVERTGLATVETLLDEIVTDTKVFDCSTDHMHRTAGAD